ncbi:MAG: HEAT repeat domain-containing protein [Verrucomicrobiota bacterium]|nr:HEAT repeat domain-containing protein [Verrucomicrobiota bacterium]
MNRILILATVILATAGSVLSQDPAAGLNKRNLQGADLSLMTNHDPAVEQANFELMPGYEVNLFASEPMFANPIHMVWDSRGRLWVACSWAYPQLKPGQKANDKIIILEDTNQDGKADKSTVFADGLYLPTGIELANGGCYVAQSPDVFFFKDTDGDDVADVKKVALTGFGIEDSHHSISAWRRGPGGWIYFQEGIFLHTQVETQYGVVRNFNGGVYQYNPRTQQLKMFCRGTGGNPWGHVFDRWGQSFMVNNPRIMYLTPASGNSSQSVRLTPLISTEKQCGGDLATGTHLPPDIRGQLLTCRFKSRTIVRYELIEDGAGYSAKVLKPLIASKHPNFRPVDCKIGPDGAVYVADWYNSIINHGKRDFRDPRRDHDHGRIWRITAKNRPLVKRPELVNAPVQRLIQYLKSPEAWIRHQARKELSEREPGKVLMAAEAWVKTLDSSDSDYSHHLVEAMWACQNVERSSEAILKRVLQSKDGHARSAGARVIRYWHRDLSDPVGMIAQLSGDEFARVRMEAVLSAGFIPDAKAFPAALNALDHKQDKFIALALPQAVTALEHFWRPAFETGKLKFDKESHREFAEREAGLGFDKHLDSYLKKKAPGLEETRSIANRLISDGTIRQARMVVDSLGQKGAKTLPEVTLVLLDGLAQVGRRGDFSLGQRISPLKELLHHTDDAVAASAIANLGVWQLKGSDPDLFKILRDVKRATSVRQAAAVSLGQLNGAEAANSLRSLAQNGSLSERYFAVFGLIVTDLDEAAEASAGLFVQAPGQSDPAALVQAFTRLSGGSNALTRALEGKKPHPQVVDQLAEYHRRTGQLPKSLENIFHPSTPKSLSALLIKENRKTLTADVAKLGDPVRGENVYRRKALACFSCHAIGPAGSHIGPNLVAVGAAAQTDYVIEAILQPNKAIAQHYENKLITLIDGAIHMGTITFQSEKEVVLQDSALGGKEVKIPMNKVRKMKPMPSLMPAGLADQLKTRQEFLDLAKFVSLLGRPGPYANDESPVIRKWRIKDGDQPGSIPSAKALWLPAYSMVNGELPAADLGRGKVVYARGYIDVLVAGNLKLQLNDAKGLRLWVEGKEVTDLTRSIHLDKGRRTMTFAIDRAKRGKTGLRVELIQVPGSSAKFKPVGGI